jgi:hypothetical protein
VPGTEQGKQLRVVRPPGRRQPSAPDRDADPSNPETAESSAKPESAAQDVAAAAAATVAQRRRTILEARVLDPLGRAVAGADQAGPRLRAALADAVPSEAAIRSALATWTAVVHQVSTAFLAALDERRRLDGVESAPVRRPSGPVAATAVADEDGGK